MRGGTANCAVIISDQEIASPLVVHPTSLIVMNKPSLLKFEDCVKPGGRIVVNESLIDRKVTRQDVAALYVPANNMAEEAGSGRSGNMVMIGAWLAVTGLLSQKGIKESLPEVVSKRNLRYNDINERAIDMGFEYAQNAG